MAASDKTTEEVFDILERHLTREQIVAVLRDLGRVDGNRSFRVTVGKLKSLAADRIAEDIE